MRAKAPAPDLRRRRALQRGRRRACRLRRAPWHCRWPRPRPARARSTWTHPPQCRRDRRHRHGCRQWLGAARPICCWPSARGCRISPPARGRSGRAQGAADPAQYRRASTRPSMAHSPCIADARAGPRRARRRARRLAGAGGVDRSGPRPRRAEWQRMVDRVTTAPKGNALPSDAQVLGAVNRKAGDRDIMVARPAACRASCTSSGAPASPRAITWNTAIPAWAMRSPAASGSSSPSPSGGSSCWWATAAIS